MPNLIRKLSANESQEDISVIEDKDWTIYQNIWHFSNVYEACALATSEPNVFVCEIEETRTMIWKIIPLLEIIYERRWQLRSELKKLDSEIFDLSWACSEHKELQDYASELLSKREVIERNLLKVLECEMKAKDRDWTQFLLSI